MSGMIPNELVEQVRHASDIVDVVGSYVPLKKSGAIPPGKSSSASAAATAAMCSSFSC